MVTSITEGLNILNDLGVFSYVIPFLLIFAVVYAILEKSKVLGDNNGIMVIIASSLGLLSLQFDFVSVFFSVIFPRFGIGLSLFLVALIFMGFFVAPKDLENKLGILGGIVALAVVIWSITSWDAWSSYNGFGGFFAENIWAIIILVSLIAIIASATSKPKEKSKKKEGE